MELKPYLEAGKIVNTHGIRGEVKIQPWCDSAQFLADMKRLYIDGVETAVQSARIHKDCVIALLEGVTDVNAAMCLKGKIVLIDRRDVTLGEGEYFIADIIGLPVFDSESGNQIGVLREVLEYPASSVYVVAGETEHLVPAVPQFVKKVDLENGAVYIRLIEGM